MKPFWSDDFDMDLLKVLPDIAAEIGAFGDRTFWTVGHETHGRLNHPAVWNTHGAYLWREKPNLERDKYGWANINGCVTNDPEIECTWLEFLRDMWAHHFNVIVLPDNLLLRGSSWEQFERIMGNMRGWNKRDVSDDIKAARHWALTLTEIMK